LDLHALGGSILSNLVSRSFQANIEQAHDHAAQGAWTRGMILQLGIEDLQSLAMLTKHLKGVSASFKKVSIPWIRLQSLIEKGQGDARLLIQEFAYCFLHPLLHRVRMLEALERRPL